jgi:hypothetical protein
MLKKPIPPLTCIHIDRIEELISSIVNLSTDPEVSRDVLGLYKDIIIAELEFVRLSNDELRIASAHWYKKAKLFKHMTEKLRGERK